MGMLLCEHYGGAYPKAAFLGLLWGRMAELNQTQAHSHLLCKNVFFSVRH